jgi:hypothetical protein
MKISTSNQEFMDHTPEFRSIAQRIATVNGKKIQILNKPKSVNTWMKSARELNEELFLFQEYLKSIRNSYLDIREWKESTPYLSFPRGNDVLAMNSQERNELDLQLIRYLDILFNKQKKLIQAIPSNLSALSEPLDAIFQDCFKSIREFHKSMQKKRTAKEISKKKYFWIH